MTKAGESIEQLAELEAKKNAQQFEQLDLLLANMNSVMVGLRPSVFLAATAFLAGGHVLLEDVPGVGKTLLAKSLAKSVSAGFKRVQCTPDLLPSDVSGVNVFDQKTGSFVFEPGPIFTNLLLADEINRATPRTQSSLLEAMEEGQVTIDGETRKLPELFFVIATQNPIEYHGTFPLPEAQLDRFMMSIHLGYPTAEEELEVLEKTLQDGSFEVEPVIAVEDLLVIRQRVKGVFVSQAIQRYIIDIASATRECSELVLGVSPRGSQLLMKACQAAAFLNRRSFVKPEDVKTLAPYVFGHRVVPKQRTAKVSHAPLIEKLLQHVSVPV